MATKVLMAGESWMTHSTHVKGFDSFTTSSYHEGGTELIAALRARGVDVTYQPAHVAADQFPATREALAAFEVVILSDIGANTLLLPQRTLVRSETSSNRLQALKAFVEGGGGLLMVGGYLTFQGIDGKGNYRGTAVESILPVSLQGGDDRSERPEGVMPTIVDPDHPVMAGLEHWPRFLGYNPSLLRPETPLPGSIAGHPLLA